MAHGYGEGGYGTFLYGFLDGVDLTSLIPTRLTVSSAHVLLTALGVAPVCQAIALAPLLTLSVTGAARQAEDGVQPRLSVASLEVAVSPVAAVPTWQVAAGTPVLTLSAAGSAVSALELDEQL